MNPTKVELIKKYRLASCDITCNCNLRCKFCFNDFSQKNFNMTADIFRNVFQVVDFVPKADDVHGTGFYFSCLWEPSISPYFLELLQLISKEDGEKVFFTSNFAKKFKEEEIEQLAKTNIDHINISIETLERDKYKVLTGGTDFNYEIFFSNLEMIHNVFSKYPDAPKIRYISMALKSNYKELGEIVEKCHNEYHAYMNEIRTPFSGGYIEKFRHELLNKEEISYLENLFTQSDKKISYCLEEIVLPDEVQEAVSCNEQIASEPEKKKKADALPALSLRSLPEWHYDIRIESNGNVSWNANGDKFAYDENADYHKLFADGLEKITKTDADRYVLDREVVGAYKKLPLIPWKKSFFNVDDFLEDEHFISLRGWAGVKGVDSKGKQKILELTEVGNAKNATYYLCEDENRSDVAEIMNEPFEMAGFRVLIDKESLAAKSLQAKMYFYDKEKNRITYTTKDTIELNL